MTKKSGLKVRDVSKDHFSSGVKNEPKFSRIVVRIIECKQLLASDVETGKSDPICFIWCGFKHEHPTIQALLGEDKQGGIEGEQAAGAGADGENKQGDEENHETNVLHTSVCYTTTDPMWHEEDKIFPIDPEEVDQLANMKLIIFVRDEDRDENDVISYDELGMLEVPLTDVILKGKAMHGSIVLPAAWYKLEKSPGMRRIDGTIKLTISIILAPDDHEAIQKRLQSPGPNLMQTRSLGPGQLLQYNVQQQSQQSDDASVRGSVSGFSKRPRSANSPGRISSGGSVVSTASGRPTSATKRRNASKQDATKNRVGSMIRRPLSSRGHSDDISVLSEEREGGEEDEELVVVPKEKENELREKQEMDLSRPAGGSHRYADPPAEVHDDLFSFAPEKVLAEDHDDVLLQSGPPMADQSFLDEMVRMGIESAGHVIDKMDLGDVVQDAALHVAKAAATKAKKWIEPGVSEVLASAKVHGANMAKTMGERIVDSVDANPAAARQQLAATLPAMSNFASEVQDGISDYRDYAKVVTGSGGGSGGRGNGPNWKRKGSRHEEVGDSYEDLLNSGPIAGDNLVHGEEERPSEMHVKEDDEMIGRDREKGEAVEGENGHEGSVVESLSKEIEQATQSRRNSRPLHRDENQQFSSSGAIDEQALVSAAGGGGMAAVRVIRSELEYQRDFIKKTLFAIAKSTDNGFQRVSSRLATLEHEVHHNKTSSSNGEINKSSSPSRLRSKEQFESDPAREETRPRSRSPKNLRSSSGATSTNNNRPNRTTTKGTSGLKNHIKKARQQDHFTGSFAGSTTSNQEPKDPPVQFVFRGENGNIASTAMAAPPPVPSDLFMGQLPTGDQALPPGGPAESFNPRNNVRNSGFGFPSDNPAKNPLLNKDFHEVLENGSLEDVSNMLESCAAKPDQLSASTRNRLFDLISTLLIRGKKVERPMLWVTNLLTTPDLFYQMAPHTQNDVIAGLKYVAEMSSNSGMLAILLLKKIRTMES